MPTMKITTKGQVTIPQGIREQLGMLPGSDVEFRVAGKAVKIVLTQSSQDRGQKLILHLRNHAPTIRMTTDEIMALTRGE